MLPGNATNPAVTWSVASISGGATISASGLLTALVNGVVLAKAIAQDGSGVVGTLTITISGNAGSVPVANITVTGAGNATTITTSGGTLQMSAAVLPANATNKNVTWSVTNVTGQATITAGGLLTAVANGTVTAKATAQDGSGVSGSLGITISGQPVLVSSITVTGAGNATAITINGGTLQMFAAVLPANATNQAVTWSVVNGTGQATISSGGLLTAVANGTVTVKATAQDTSGVFGSLGITISGQSSPTYTVTYNGNGNTGGSAPVDPMSPYPSGTSVSVLNQGGLTKTGYTFANWNAMANGSGTSSMLSHSSPSRRMSPSMHSGPRLRPQ